MPSSTVVFLHIDSRQLVPRLLGQPRRMGPSVAGRSLGLRCVRPPCCLTADLGLELGGGRSQHCRWASTGPAWALPSSCNKSPPNVKASASVTAAPLCLCRLFCSSASLCFGRHRSTGSKMSSSSSEGQGKPKSPLRKRGSLQSTTSPGEWRGVGAGVPRERSKGMQGLKGGAHLESN